MRSYLPLVEGYSEELEPGKPAYGVQRTEFWPSRDEFGHYPTARAYGSLVAQQVIEVSGGYAEDSERVMRMVSMVAIAKPPLLGKSLLAFLSGAAEVAEAKAEEQQAVVDKTQAAIDVSPELIY